MPHPYRVLLLKPKILAKAYGREVVYLQVEEASPDEAIVAAQQQAYEEGEHPECEPGDWHPLLVIEGYEDNIAPAPEPDRRFKPDQDEAIYLSRLLEEVARDAPTAARSAFALRLFRKLKNASATKGPPEIVLTGVEHRVLEHILYGRENDGLDSREPEMVHRLCLRLIGMLPVINDNNLD
jgi:hypothetical protein